MIMFFQLFLRALHHEKFLLTLLQITLFRSSCRSQKKAEKYQRKSNKLLTNPVERDIIPTKYVGNIYLKRRKKKL